MSAEDADYCLRPCIKKESTECERLDRFSRCVPVVVYQYQSLPDGSHSIPFISHRIIDLLGVTPDEAMSDADAVIKLIHPLDRNTIAVSIRESARDVTPWYGEFRVILPDQAIRWIEAEATLQQLEDGGCLWYGYAKDVTERVLLEHDLRETQEKLLQIIEERTDKLLHTNKELAALNKEAQEEIIERIKLESKLKQSHELLSLLATDLVLSEERERRRIAVELHDDVVQHLALGKLRLDMTVEDGEPPSDLLKAVTELIANTMQQVRRICNDLSPPLLYDLGLPHAIESLGERLAHEHRFRFTLKGGLGKNALSDHLRTVLYQTARELMVNVVKHANAKNLLVQLGTKRGAAQLKVIDDGVGFGPSVQKGFGLTHIQQRIEFLKGRLTVASTVKGKTVVRVVVPLAP